MLLKLLEGFLGDRAAHFGFVQGIESRLDV